jgi:hypothetical protein
MIDNNGLVHPNQIRSEDCSISHENINFNKHEIAVFLSIDPYTAGTRNSAALIWDKGNSLNFLYHFGDKYQQLVTGGVMIKMLNTAYWCSLIMATLKLPLFKFQSLDTTCSI